MANLQVKDIDDELYAELRRRAALEGTTIRDYTLQLIRQALARPTAAEWLAMAEALHPAATVRPAAEDLTELRGERS
ncbi:MAG TPA: hypothetical protein VMM13_01860 [Euzebya sp.]|nr:hypothetical protein [Euzebya sp.]